MRVSQLIFHLQATNDGGRPDEMTETEGPSTFRLALCFADTAFEPIFCLWLRQCIEG